MTSSNYDLATLSHALAYIAGETRANFMPDPNVVRELLALGRIEAHPDGVLVGTPSDMAERFRPVRPTGNHGELAKSIVRAQQIGLVRGDELAEIVWVPGDDGDVAVVRYAGGAFLCVTDPVGRRLPDFDGRPLGVSIHEINDDQVAIAVGSLVHWGFVLLTKEAPTC